MVLLHLALLIFFLAVLIKSSDYFVEAVARIANYFGVSEFVIGLTVIAIGTSLPELGSSFMASLEGVSELAVGNIIGSNIANIGLILGLSTIIRSVKTGRKIFIRDALILLGVSCLFFIFSSDSSLDFFEGAILFSIVPLYILYLFEVGTAIRKKLYRMNVYFDSIRRIFGDAPELSEKISDKLLTKEQYDDFVGKGFDIEGYKKLSTRVSKFRKKILKDVVISLASGVLIYMSAKYMIPEAVALASGLGVTENIIGATLIAFGTSLPELSVSISSIRKGFSDMLLGNIMGSNLFNLALVGGLSAMANPLNALPVTRQVSLPLMLSMTGFLFIFIRTKWRVERYEGAILFSFYLLFIILLVSGGI